MRHEFEWNVQHSFGAYARPMRRPAVFAVRVPILQEIRNPMLTAVRA